MLPLSAGNAPGRGDASSDFPAAVGSPAATPRAVRGLRRGRRRFAMGGA
jgi:hypothetical protein